MGSFRDVDDNASQDAKDNEVSGKPRKPSIAAQSWYLLGLRFLHREGHEGDVARVAIQLQHREQLKRLGTLEPRADDN